MQKGFQVHHIILAHHDEANKHVRTSRPAVRIHSLSAVRIHSLLAVHTHPQICQNRTSNGRHVSCQVVKMVKYGVAGDPRCQDEMLKQLPPVAEQTEYTTLKSELLPRMHTLCLKTTSASVRVNSLTCMGRIVARLDEDEAGKMLQTAGKVSLLVCLRLPMSKHPI